MDRLIGLCRSFLWSWPRVAWNRVCLPKKEGGLGLFDLRARNLAFMSKHYQHIHTSRDSLWVRWIHHRYLQVTVPCDWVAHIRDSPLIKAILGARDEIVRHMDPTMSLSETLDSWCHGEKFLVTRAYDIFRERGHIVDWYRLVWDSGNTPKHCFILWMCILGRLSTRDRLRFLDIDPTCSWCRGASESHDHLFFGCTYAREVW